MFSARHPMNSYQSSSEVFSIKHLRSQTKPTSAPQPGGAAAQYYGLDEGMKQSIWRQREQRKQRLPTDNKEQSIFPLPSTNVIISFYFHQIVRI
jgi:type VI protein secretion system component VasA